MSREGEDPTTPQNTQARFAETHWTLVVKAGGSTSPEARDGLNQLCRDYWYPLYAFIRRQGHNPEEAKDLTQSFFIHLLEKELIKKADPEKGKFRTFLLKCLTNFMRDEWRKRTAQFRGGGQQLFSIDELEAEARYSALPAQEPDSTKIFDRAWATTLISLVKAKLKKEYAAKGQSEVFDALEPYLTGASNRGFYAKACEALKKDENAVGVLLHRLRKDFGSLLRSEISQTVVSRADIDQELRYLLEAWSGASGITRKE